MNDQVIRIATWNEISKLIPAFRELRPHRTEDELLRLLSAAYEEGYRVAYIGTDALAFAILGFRILTFIFGGKTLKVDDLATLSPYKRKGYATKLFEWATELAYKNDCDRIVLDSGFTRYAAHRFYLNHGLQMESLHFSRMLKDKSTL